jgi:Phospholipase_D-nuclease N-terminal
MVLACLLLALFTVGLVVPCVIDIATSPPWAIRTLSKGTWLLIAVVFSVAGCAAWLIAGRPRRIPMLPRGAPAGLAIGPAEALRRHPAGRAMGLDLDEARDRDTELGPRRARPLGPDDDPEFLMELERRIRESRGDH